MAALGAAAGGCGGGGGGAARDWRTGAPIIYIYDTTRLVPGGTELLTRGLGAADPPGLFRACVESNFDTRMALVLPTTTTAEEMEEAVEKAHLRNFPEHGKIACSKLMVMAHGYWYSFSHGPVGALVQGTDARFKAELVSERGVFPSHKPQQQENINQRSRLPQEPQKVLEKDQQEDQRYGLPEEPQTKELVVEKGHEEIIDRLPEEHQKKEMVLEKAQQGNMDQRSRLPEEPQKELVLEKDEELLQQENINQGFREMPSGSRLLEETHITSFAGTRPEDDNMIDGELRIESTVPTSKHESQNGILNQGNMRNFILPSNEEIGEVVSTSRQELSAHPVASEENEQGEEKTRPEAAGKASTSVEQEASGADAMLAMLVKPYETRKGKAPAVDLSGQAIKENEALGKTTTLEASGMLVKPSETKQGKADLSEQGMKEDAMPEAAGMTISGADTVLVKRKAQEVHVEPEKSKKLKVDISDHLDGETVEKVDRKIGVTNASEEIPEQMETKKEIVHTERSVGEEKPVKANATHSTGEKESDSTTNSGASTGAVDSEINKNLDDIMANLMTQHFPPASPSVERNPIPSSTAFGDDGSRDSDSESSNDRNDYDEVAKKAGDVGNMKTSKASIEKAAKKVLSEAEIPQERSGDVGKDELKAPNKNLVPTTSGSTTQESDLSIKNRAAPQDVQPPPNGSSAESSESSESSSSDESESTMSEKWKKTASTVPRSRRNSTAVAPASVPVRRNPRRNSVDSRFEHFIENKNGLEELLNLRMQKRMPTPADVANDSPSVDVVLETQDIQGGNTVCKQAGSSEQGDEEKSDREEPKIAETSKIAEQDKERVESKAFVGKENEVNNDKDNDVEATNSILKECAERYQKIITKEKQDVPVKEASTETGEARPEQKPDKTGKKSRVKRIATRDMIQASTETSDCAPSEDSDSSRKRRKKFGDSKPVQSNSNLERKATRSERKKAETMKAETTKAEATKAEATKAETKAIPSKRKAAKVSGGETCPGCGKVYARKTSAFYSHKKSCTATG